MSELICEWYELCQLFVSPSPWFLPCQVEPPGRGDALRSLRTLDASGTSLWWRCHGRNRRCMTIDMQNPEGRQASITPPVI